MITLERRLLEHDKMKNKKDICRILFPVPTTASPRAKYMHRRLAKRSHTHTNIITISPRQAQTFLKKKTQNLKNRSPNLQPRHPKQIHLRQLLRVRRLGHKVHNALVGRQIVGTGLARKSQSTVDHGFCVALDVLA
jgi:hypothetical protein